MPISLQWNRHHMANSSTAPATRQESVASVNGHSNGKARQPKKITLDAIRENGFHFVLPTTEFVSHVAQTYDADAVTHSGALRMANQDRKFLVIAPDDQIGYAESWRFASKLAAKSGCVHLIKYGGLGTKWPSPDEWLRENGSTFGFGVQMLVIDPMVPRGDVVVRIVPGSQPPRVPLPQPSRDLDYKTCTDEQLGIITAESVEIAPIKWLWKYRMAIGELTLVAGEGGEGKSQTSLAFAATISRGGEWPDKSGFAEIGDVIIVSAEDDRATTLKPRLVASGADLSRITFLTAKTVIKHKDKPDHISMMSLQDLDYWHAVLDRRPGCKLMIFDPLPSYLGRGVNDSKNMEIRQVLEPFLDCVVRKHGIAMLAITHLNKSVDLKTPVHRITGSIAYANIPRNVHFVARDPDNDGQAYFAMAKCNNAPKNHPAMTFSIMPAVVPGQDGEPIETSFALFSDQTVEIRLRDVVAGESGHRGPKADNTLAEWLWSQLQEGPKTIVELVERARADGHLKEPTAENPKPSIVSLYNAKERLPILHDGWLVEERSTRGMTGVKGKKLWSVAPNPMKQLGNSEPL